MSERILSAGEVAMRTAVETKLRDDVQLIENARVSVVRPMRSGNPREEVLAAAMEIGADPIVMGSNSKRHVFDLGGTPQAICIRDP